MCAFIYGLNDCDERVRKESAIQIRKQTKKHPCCCNDKVVAALTYALGDCDKGVVRAATRALKACGYDVQKSACCSTASTCAPAAATCAAPVNSCAPTAPVAPAPVDSNVEQAPAAAPAPASAEPEAYFPSRLKGQQTKSKMGTPTTVGLRG
ncbi:MAG: HEAT repeat domain-containing protein [Planctomycetes bacterium]|nr:HEAT repeat domain-containing protein [Planctomycetota bacterium]